MKRLIILTLGALSALSAIAQTIPGAPAYQLPVTVVAQKWYGLGAPSTSTFPVQPGDWYFDTSTPAVYYCSAPVTATLNPNGGRNSACAIVAAGQWVLISGSTPGGGISVSMTAGTGGTTANELVKLSAATVVKTLTSDTAPDVAFGVAASTVSATGTVQVAVAGTVSCVADTGGITAGNLVGAGTTVASTCVDLGQTAVSSVAPNIAILGRALTTATATNAASILLFPQTGAGYATTGTGTYVRATSPTIVTPVLTTPTVNNPVIAGPAPTACGASCSPTTGQLSTCSVSTGCTFTLPTSAGTGNVIIMRILTTTASSGGEKVLLTTTSDVIIGTAYVENGGTVKAFVGNAGTYHSLQMPFSGSQPSGGFNGDTITCTDMAAGTWACDVASQAGTGTQVTPYSTATT